MPEVELLMLPEEQRRAARARPPLPDIVAQQGAIADAFMRQRHSSTRITHATTPVMPNPGAVGAPRPSTQPGAASAAQGQSCTTCGPSVTPSAVPRPVQSISPPSSASAGSAATLFAGSSCAYEPPLYVSPSGSGGIGTYADVFSCGDGIDCTTTGGTHKCCYRLDSGCEQRMCTWGPIDLPPIHDLWVLHEQTALFITVEGFDCTAHVDLVRAALWLLNRAARDGDFFDWLWCTFLAAAQHPGGPVFSAGNINMDRLRGLVGGPFVTVSAPTVGVEYLRIIQDNNPTMSVTRAPPGSGQLPAEVYVRTDHALFDTMAAAWNWGTDDERVCAALRLSAAIGHELLHITGADNTNAVLDDPSTNFSEGKCSHWHIYMNSYLWALSMRLQWQSGPSTCCGDFASNAFFYSDCNPSQLFLHLNQAIDLTTSYCIAAASPQPPLVTLGPLYATGFPLTREEWVCPFRGISPTFPLHLP